MTEKEGGRKTPFFSGYRPTLEDSLPLRYQFYVRTTDVTGKVASFTADDGSATEMVLPGDRTYLPSHFKRWASFRSYLSAMS